MATVLYDEYNMVASTLFLTLHTSFACYRRAWLKFVDSLQTCPWVK